MSLPMTGMSWQKKLDVTKRISRNLIASTLAIEKDFFKSGWFDGQLLGSERILTAQKNVVLQPKYTALKKPII